MKKIYLFTLFLLGLCSCANNQETADKSEIDSTKTRSVEVKSVRDYVESNEFISIIPDEYYSLREKGRASKEEIKSADYQMKAAAYRFYKHCTQNEDGIITCNAESGKDINISEEIFELRIRDMESCNEWVRKCKREGKNYKITRLDEKYFNGLLNYE